MGESGVESEAGAAASALLDGAARLAAAPTDALTAAEVLDLLGDLEELTRRLPALRHRLVARLERDAAAVELGSRNLRQLLRDRLRIGGAEARRRIEDADALGPRTSLAGAELAPRLPLVAAAQAAGRIGPDHVRIILAFFDQLPSAVPHDVRERAERDLVDAAVGLDPDAVRVIATRLAMMLDQDGPEPAERDRARRRGVVLSPQGRDGMSRIAGWLDPRARATLDAVFAVWAAPGMVDPEDPEDPEPRRRGTPPSDRIAADARSQAQRQHDALAAIAEDVLRSGVLGSHHGLPATIVASTTVAQLRAASGWATTATGSLLPMRDLIALAGRAVHYLAVFDGHTEIPLYLGRSKRLASAGQRLVLASRDRGCTKPGCTVPASGCQVHHVRGWAVGGTTDIDVMVLACPADNRLAESGPTVSAAGGRVRWIPPPLLESGQARINVYHHPERFLRRDEPEP